jgi:hypothetical protein
MTSRSWVNVGLVVFVLLVIAAWAIPARQGYLHRGRVDDAVRDGLRDEIRAALLQATGPTTFMPKSRYAKSIRIDRIARTIHVALDADAIGHLEVQPGASLLYTAIVERGAIAGWKCARDRIPAKLLPAACRE